VLHGFILLFSFGFCVLLCILSRLATGHAIGGGFGSLITGYIKTLAFFFSVSTLPGIGSRGSGRAVRTCGGFAWLLLSMCFAGLSFPFRRFLLSGSVSLHGLRRF